MLKLNNTIFQVDNDQSRLYIKNIDNGYKQISLDIVCKDQEYDGELCCPCVNINWHDTQLHGLQGLVDLEIIVSSVEESDEREDTFYLFEHEPFANYILKFIEIQNDKVNILLNGTVIVDGYADPYETTSFDANCWLSIKCID